MIQSLIFAIHNLYYAFKWTNLVSFKGMIFNSQMKTFLTDRKSFLFILAVGNTIAFATWQVLLNNFVVERAAFTGEEIGILQSLREVPGFLAFTAIGVLLLSLIHI